LGVGYELGKAEVLDKPILCLYRPQPGKKLSAMLVGDPKIKVRDYQKLDELPKIFKEFFATLTA
ncbi:MAG TPA: nucleoside 2-deoxyribosyltransferase, partial [Candidatus Paceibacterota bacterium]|nr:nucleoside 2-deoxyribosyltransferase [Candidatus Paceibacterota bacterium]